MQALFIKLPNQLPYCCGWFEYTLSLDCLLPLEVVLNVEVELSLEDSWREVVSIVNVPIEPKAAGQVEGSRAIGLVLFTLPPF